MKTTLYLTILLLCPFFISCNDKEDSTTLKNIYGTWYSESENGEIDKNDSNIYIFYAQELKLKFYTKSNDYKNWELTQIDEDETLNYTTILQIENTYPSYFTTKHFISQKLINELKQKFKDNVITQKEYDVYLEMFTIRTEMHFKIPNSNQLVLKIITDKRNEDGGLTGEKEENIIKLRKISE